MVLDNYVKYKEQKLEGRRITLKSILPLIDQLNDDTSVLGYSFLNRPIYKITLGTGKIKVLIWSQMHGNESTGTKAIFDLLNFFNEPLDFINYSQHILEKCTIVIIPMLNPDGAEVFTRVNAQKIDLNRDAIDLKAPESKLLNTFIHDYKPDYCFNLHDQRNLFSVGKENLPATLSFLAPSEDEKRTLTKGRKKTMEIIVAMHNALKPYIPNQIGRFTDEFYPTATGDNFQKAGFNTILIEAGHFPLDHDREETRKYNFLALASGLSSISNTIKPNYESYFDIPINQKKNFETVLNNVNLKGEKYKIGLYYTPKFKNKTLSFVYDYEFLSINSQICFKNSINKTLNFNSKDELVFYISKLD